jgi:WD40 repeat protein
MLLNRASAILFALTLTLSLQASRSSSGHISEAGQMLTARSGHTATLLKDGRVLIAGGMVRNGEILDVAELYDSITGKFSLTGKMTTKRVGQVAVLLEDGRVLIAGGWSDKATSSAEVYDPISGKFSPLQAMTMVRAGASATVLQDGRVLIAGGGVEDRVGLRTAELFDPRTNKFVSTGSMHDGRIEHTATLLKDGAVLVTGGMANGHVVATAERFDPKTGDFTNVNAMHQARYKHTAQLLADGRVLVAGGADDRDWKGVLSDAEIYDPARHSFTSNSSMSQKRFKLPHESALLSDGKVLIAGGDGQAEAYDPKTSAFTALDSGTGSPQWFMTETTLKDGRVLLAGGYSKSMEATNRVWLYH